MSLRPATRDPFFLNSFARKALLALFCLLGSAALFAAPQAGFGDIQTLEPTPTPAVLAPLEEPAQALPTPSSEPAKSQPGGGLASLPPHYVLLALVVLVVVSTIIVVLAVVLKPTETIVVPSRSGLPAVGADGLPPAEWVDSGPVRTGRPPEGTLKILPGRFVVDDADGPIDLRIFRTSGENRVETTIGREAGSPYRHIQFKPLSVSGKHAKLVYENGFYSIVNYSRVNPTRVNDEVLEEGASRRLVHEDRIEVGEVLMIYYES